MKPFSDKTKIVKKEFMSEKGISSLTNSQKLEIENANRSGKKSTRQKQEKDIEFVEYSESGKLRSLLIEDGYKKTTSNVYTNDDIFIRITEKIGCDVALVEDFESWNFSKINVDPIIIPLTRKDYDSFMNQIENILENI